MFERIFEEDPYIQKMQAKGELKGRRSDILTIIETHYPQLTALAQQKIEKIEMEDQLKSLLLQVYNLRDEQALKNLLVELPS